MDSREIFSRTDHTLLRMGVSWHDVETVCEEAARYHAASVCIAPSCVSRIHQQYPNLPITTVVGFPLGFNTTGTKVFETEQAIIAGASEIDMVINLGDVKNKAYHRVMAEIAAVKRAAGEHILKVIIETCYLDEREKIELCSVLGAAGADYLKTSTGFGPQGADLSDMPLFRKHLPDGVKIKASGGIHTRQQMEAFLAAGADRLGCSTTVKALFGDNKKTP